MAKTKKTQPAAPAAPRAAAPRRRAPARKAAPATGTPTDLASVSATLPVAVASDMSVAGTPEGIADLDGTAPAPTHDEIAEAAYHRYLLRGGGHGMDYEDWLEAERALRSRR